ncbi:MAG: alpha/beta hydrolase [bacterium]|nr:alpha/beta hydrolase [bacterium]MDZ4285309.1 alpha/beta hydrolase [Candidatus Sungbacteria bacterium]
MKIIVQNLATEYKDEGTGKVILFLHGWQDDLRTFDSLVSILSSAYRCMRLDLPGFGQSELPKVPWDLDTYVLFVKSFVEKFNLEVDTIIGHSFGGRIVIKGVATKNLQPRKIVLIGSAGVAPKRSVRNSILKVVAKIGGLITYVPPLLFWRKELREKMYEYIGSDYGNAGALKETLLKIISEDLSENAKQITVSTLLIWGADDTETPLSEGEELSRLIQSSQLKVISGAGHFVHREKAQEVARLMQEFV